MSELCFRAVDENGKSYHFDTLLRKNSILLTLKKQTIEGVNKLWVLPDLGTARAGDDGFTLNSLDPASPIYREDLANGITQIGSYFTKG